MELMESPNFLDHAELLDDNTPQCLNAFHKYLIQQVLSRSAGTNWPPCRSALYPFPKNAICFQAIWTSTAEAY